MSVVVLLLLGLLVPTIVVSQIEICSAMPPECMTIGKDIKADTFIVGNKRMQLIHEEKSWDEAKKDCHDRKQKLLTLFTKEENEQLRDYFNKRIWGDKPICDMIHWYIWTSGTDAEKEGVWKWATTGKKFTYSSWLNKDEPNGGETENCMEMRLVTRERCFWYAADCKAKKKYICEMSDSGLTNGQNILGLHHL